MSSPSAPHIVVVDDDPKVRTLLRHCFEGDGYRVSEASGGRELEQCLVNGDVSLITLDLNLGGEDGLTIARDIRSRSDVPIIMVTGKGDMIDTVVGLEVGADDYISKPFHVREVLARVHTVLRRAQAISQAQHKSGSAGTGERYSFHDWIVDIPKRMLVSSSGDACELTTSEFDLLSVFVKNTERVLSRDQIMDQLKGQDWNPYDRSIDNMVAKLRKKIEPDPDHPKLIKTVRGVGYSFAVDVERL